MITSEGSLTSHIGTPLTPLNHTNLGSWGSSLLLGTQALDHRPMMVSLRKLNRGVPCLVPQLLGGLGPDQGIHHLQVPQTSSHMEGSLTLPQINQDKKAHPIGIIILPLSVHPSTIIPTHLGISSIDIDPMIEEQPHHGGVAMESREVDRGPLEWTKRSQTEQAQHQRLNH